MQVLSAKHGEKLTDKQPVQSASVQIELRGVRLTIEEAGTLGNHPEPLFTFEKDGRVVTIPFSRFVKAMTFNPFN